MGRAAKSLLRKPPVILVLGEDDNDRTSIGELLLALRDDLPRIEKRRKPLVLMKDRHAARSKKNAQDIEAQVRRDGRRFEVRAVVAHQDCDDVEPAHQALSATIQERLSGLGVEVIAATPAFEIEAWLFLWPDAACMVNARWSRPARTGTRVGNIENAKEAFRRAVRGHPQGKPPRDYEESDCPRILAKVRACGLVSRLDAISDSYVMFRDSVLALEP